MCARASHLRPLQRLLRPLQRLLGDSLFLTKLSIEIGIGVCTKISAEYTKRQGNFVKEADFVLANVIMAIIAGARPRRRGAASSSAQGPRNPCAHSRLGLC